MQYKGSSYNFRIMNNESELLIMNMISQKKIKVSSKNIEEIEEVLNVIPHEVNQSRYYKLIENGMIIPEDVDEVKILRMKQNEMIYGTEVFYVNIMPTNDCNFRCSYCFEQREVHYMDLSTENKILKFIKRGIEKCKQLRLSWFGGEPLLCSEQVLRMSRKINEYCRQYKVPIYGEISTNGYELSVSIFKELIENHITNFQICLDGPEEFHNKSRPHCNNNDSYQKILQNLQSIKEQVNYGAFTIMIRTNVTPKVEGHMKQHICKMKELFGDDKRFVLVFQCVRDWGGHKIDETQIVESESVIYKNLYNFASKIGINSASSLSFAPIVGNCQACRKNGFLIDYNGELHKCSLAYHNNLFHEIDKIGIIMESGKAKIDENKLAKWLIDTDDNDSNCEGCVLFPFCMGSHCAYAKNIMKKTHCNKYILVSLQEHLLQFDLLYKIEHLVLT